MNNEHLKSSVVQAVIGLGLGVGSAFLAAALGIPLWAYLCLVVAVTAACLFVVKQEEQKEQKEQEALAEHVIAQARDLREAREELHRLRSGD